MIKNSHVHGSKVLEHDIKLDDVKIAYRELLSAVIAMLYFAPDYPSSWIRTNTDNQNVVSWLNTARCSKRLWYRLLAVIELMKFKYNLKVSAYFIESSKNTSADMLSRGKIPEWLEKRGIKYNVNMVSIEEILSNPINFWKNKKSRCRGFHGANQIWSSDCRYRHCIGSMPPVHRCSCPVN